MRAAEDPFQRHPPQSTNVCHIVTHYPHLLLGTERCHYANQNGTNYSDVHEAELVIHFLSSGVNVQYQSLGKIFKSRTKWHFSVRLKR